MEERSRKARSIRAGDDFTLVNTLQELAIPGYMLLNYEADIRAEDELSAGGSGVLYKATLTNPTLIQKYGTDLVVLKNVLEADGDAKNVTRKGFEQEVSIMWALNFHPNIVRSSISLYWKKKKITLFFFFFFFFFFSGQIHWIL